jgi:hypothetical protein
MPPAGVLTRCRLYIPAYTLWGAVTNELGKRELEFPLGNEFDLGNVRNYYEKIGNYLKENTRLSYLYPAERVQETWKAWLPRYKEGQGLCWLREDQADREPPTIHRAFRSRLLYTRLSTAIERTSGTAADETLHETECLQAFWRSDKKNEVKPVAMVGYVFIKTNGSEKLLEELGKIKHLFVGADTRYGLGQLDCEDHLKPQSQFFNLTVELNDPTQVVVRDCSYVLGHTKNHHPLRGELELTGKWNRDQIDANKEYYWSPGSSVTSENTIEFSIKKLTGYWEMSSP